MKKTIKGKNKLKNGKGITLIALIITIIVLLILATVTILALTGDQGLFAKAREARTSTQNKSEEEQIKLAVMASWDTDGELKPGVTKTNLLHIQEADVYGDDFPFTVTYRKTGNSYMVNGSGIINKSIDWQEKFADALANPDKYRHPDQNTDTRIAFDENGNSVNMDLWNTEEWDNYYTLIGIATPSGGWSPPSWEPGYLGDIGEDGVLHDEIPMYIQSNNNQSDFLPVTGLNHTFFNMSELKQFPEIPATIVSIGYESFKGCSGLTNVKIPDGVINIGQSAFEDCTNLGEISFPDTILYIDQDPFLNTKWLNEQPIGVVYAGRVAYACKGVVEGTLVLKPGTKATAYGAFCQTAFSSVVFPDGLKVIGRNAFLWGGTKLTSITIPSSVENIDSAFPDCHLLTTVTIDSAGVVSGLTDFISQGGLIYNATTIYIKSDITEIGSYVISNYTKQATSDKAGYDKYVRNE